MIRYKSNDIVTYFCSSTGEDNNITIAEVSSINKGHKRVCIKYHNSTTSYGLTTDTTASEYSPKLNIYGTDHYFGVLNSVNSVLTNMNISQLANSNVLKEISYGYNTINVYVNMPNTNTYQSTYLHVTDSRMSYIHGYNPENCESGTSVKLNRNIISTAYVSTSTYFSIDHPVQSSDISNYFPADPVISQRIFGERNIFSINGTDISVFTTSMTAYPMYINANISAYISGGAVYYSLFDTVAGTYTTYTTSDYWGTSTITNTQVTDYRGSTNTNITYSNCFLIFYNKTKSYNINTANFISTNSSKESFTTIISDLNNPLELNSSYITNYTYSQNTYYYTLSYIFPQGSYLKRDNMFFIYSAPFMPYLNNYQSTIYNYSSNYINLTDISEIQNYSTSTHSVFSIKDSRYTFTSRYFDYTHDFVYKTGTFYHYSFSVTKTNMFDLILSISDYTMTGPNLLSTTTYSNSLSHYADLLYNFYVYKKQNIDGIYSSKTITVNLCNYEVVADCTVKTYSAYSRFYYTTTINYSTSSITSISTYSNGSYYNTILNTTFTSSNLNLQITGIDEKYTTYTRTLSLSYSTIPFPRFGNAPDVNNYNYLTTGISFSNNPLRDSGFISSEKIGYLTKYVYINGIYSNYINSSDYSSIFSNISSLYNYFFTSSLTNSTQLYSNYTFTDFHYVTTYFNPTFRTTSPMTCNNVFQIYNLIKDSSYDKLLYTGNHEKDYEFFNNSDIESISLGDVINETYIGNVQFLSYSMTSMEGGGITIRNKTTFGTTTVTVINSDYTSREDVIGGKNWLLHTYIPYLTISRMPNINV